MTCIRRAVFLSYFLALFILVLIRPAHAIIAPAIGPLQALIALLPYLLGALGTTFLALFRPSTLRKIGLFLWHQKIFSLMLVGFIGGFVYGCVNNWWRQGGPVTALQTGTDWPAFRGGADRRGYVSGSPDPTTPDAIWNYDREKNFYASPCVVGNRIYVTYANYGVFADRGAILCIDADTGNEVWRYRAGGFRATFSSPSAFGDYVVSGEGLHYVRDARVVCLNKDGKLVWELRTKSHVESSPCIYNGRVYVGAGDDGYYCIDLKPGSGGKARVVWHLAGDRYKDCETSPVAADGVVYFGLGMGGKAIVAAKADSGAELWRLDTPYPVFGSPCVANGKLFVGMGNGDMVNTAEMVRSNVIRKMREEGKPEREIAEAAKSLGAAGEVWCVDLKTKAVLWKRKLPDTVLNAVACAGDRVYFASRDKHVYCLTTSNNLVARWNAGAEIKAAPAVADEHVYVVTEAGMLHCLTADRLEPVWEMRLGSGPNFTSSPIVARGHVFAPTPLEGLRCVGRAGPPPPAVWARGDRGGAVDRSPLPARAVLAWRYPDNDDPQFQVTAPLLSLRDGIYAACTQSGQPRLLKLKLKLGTNPADEQRLLWSRTLKQPVTVPPVGLGDTLFAVEGPRGQSGRLLHCIDAATGNDRWQLPVASDASGHMTLNSKHLFVWTGRESLACYPVTSGNSPPRPLWTTEPLKLGPGGLPPEVLDGVVFVATDSALVALSEQSGIPLWTKPVALPAPCTAGPVQATFETVPPLLLPRTGLLSEPSLFGLVYRLFYGPPAAPEPKPERVKRILVATDAGLVACAPDGSAPWTAKLGRVSVPPAADDLEKLAVVTESGDFVVLRLEDGRELQRMKGALNSVPPLFGAGQFVYASDDLMVFRELKQPRRQWASTDWLGKPVTPLLLLDSNVYFATDSKGIICVKPSQQ